MTDQVRDHVLAIVEGLENPESIDCEWEDGTPNAFEYLQDALDIEYIVSAKREYLGARVLVAFGGPNIWIDTRRKVVEGYWWGEKFEASYSDALDLDEALQTLWEC